MEKYGSNKIRRMRVAYSIAKATDTHSEYAILDALPQQKWSHESTSMLRYRTLPLFLYPVLLVECHCSLRGAIWFLLLHVKPVIKVAMVTDTFSYLRCLTC
jgi:hypothetical protein